jgi:phenylpyruvate tautomerase PptA (4-oxalocrotonate tautomerase family)
VPFYISVTQEGTLSQAQRAHVAAEITRIHTEATGAPREWVHIFFQTYPPGFGFNAEKAAPASSLTGFMRTGRTPELKAKLLTDLWPVYRKATGLSDGDIVLILQELPAYQGMEMGKILPEPGEEVAWAQSLKNSA